MMMSPEAYHNRTKHHFNQYARSTGYLDWNTQPNPFRFYRGSKQIELPLLKTDFDYSFDYLFDHSKIPPQEITRKTIGSFFELSLGLSAKKSFGGSSWYLRMNPSSGNLHPTESYFIGGTEDLSSGVYHYNSYFHILEERKLLKESITPHGFYVALSSIFWREAWKYGERAYRYCQHDLGHALATLRFSALLHGWKVTYLTTLSDEEIEKLVGFNKIKWPEYENETAEALVYVWREGSVVIPNDEMIQKISSCETKGEPNQLSPDHIDWEIIHEVASTQNKPRTREKEIIFSADDSPYIVQSHHSACTIIRRRRSAVGFDGKTQMSKENLLSTLNLTLPRNTIAPFDMKIGEPHINLVVFIHLVEAFEPGVYLFIRNKTHLEMLRNNFHNNFEWKKMNDTHDLYLLQKGDMREVAATLSCGQDIAGDSAFSLGMLAKFNEVIEDTPYLYRTLFWEAGMIGQVLYLAAEAYGLGGTGIGCYFDDPVHELLGLKDTTFQSMYHFTIGGSREDTRLMSESPYKHLRRNYVD